MPHLLAVLLYRRHSSFLVPRDRRSHHLLVLAANADVGVVLHDVRLVLILLLLFGSGLIIYGVSSIINEEEDNETLSRVMRV